MGRDSLSLQLAIWPIWSNQGRKPCTKTVVKVSISSSLWLRAPRSACKRDKLHISHMQSAIKWLWPSPFQCELLVYRWNQPSAAMPFFVWGSNTPISPWQWYLGRVLYLTCAPHTKTRTERQPIKLYPWRHKTQQPLMVIGVSAGAELIQPIEGVFMLWTSKRFLRISALLLAAREMRDENKFQSLKVSGYRAAAQE